MIFDAIVLAGGRASRLTGASKADLVVEGRSLLARALDATAGAREVVVVGPPRDVPAGVLVARENPAFGGPAAAIAAGIEALSTDPASDFVLVLACDVPKSASAVHKLVARAATGVHGVIAVDAEGRRQPLLGVYRSGPLVAAVRDCGTGTGIQNLSMRALLSSLDLAEVVVPLGSTDDIDTWADAATFGIATPALPETTPPTKGPTMADRNEDATLAALTDWSDRLTAALGLDGLEVDIEAVLALAGTAAHAVMRPAAPLTTYLVGYAAGVAAGSGLPRPRFDDVAALAADLAKSGDR